MSTFKKIIYCLSLLSTAAFATDHIGDWVKYKVESNEGDQSIHTYKVISFSEVDNKYTVLGTVEGDEEQYEEEFEIPQNAIWTKKYSKVVIKSCTRIGGKHIKKDYGQGKEKFCRVDNPGPGNSTETKVYGPIPVLGFSESYTGEGSMIAIDYSWN